LSVKRWLISVFAGAVTLIAITTVALWPDQQQVASLPDSPLTNAMRWREGSLQNYRVELDSILRMGLAQGQSLPVEVTLNGMLAFNTLQVSEQQSLVGLQFTGLELLISGASDAQTKSQLQQPFRVRYSRDGVPLVFEFSAQMPEDSRQILRNVMTTFQTSLQPGSTWQARESSAGRDYEAIYSVKTPGTIEKNKLRFFDNNAVDTQPTADTVSSDEVIRIATNADWLTSMKITETIESITGDTLQATTNTDALIELVSSKPRLNSNAWSFLTADTPTALTVTDRLSLSEARVRLAKNVSGLEGEATARPGNIKSLSELVRDYPELSTVVVEQLYDEDLLDRAKADLFLVLELAGTNEAQAALSLLITDSNLDEMANLRAIVALSGIQTPTVDTIDSLWSTAYGGAVYQGDARPNTAVLALGSIAGTLRTATADDAGITDQLLGGAFSSSDIKQRAVYLSALGNTGDSSLQPRLLPLLDDPSSRIRRETAAQLERLGSDQVTQELADHFYTESSGEVRGAIAAALITWESPTSVMNNAVMMAVATEQNEQARYNMTRFLTTHADGFPANKPALRRLAQTERSERIRSEIAAMSLKNN
jgi:hypothetical protein